MNTLAYSLSNNDRSSNNVSTAYTLTQFDGNCQDEYEIFKTEVRENFIKGSGIDPLIFDAAVEFCRELEWSAGNTPEFPIHEALGWHKSRFGKIKKQELFAAFLKNEDGSIWQVVLNVPSKHRKYSYFAPKGIGDKCFFPPVPAAIRQKIAELWNTDIPSEGSFWDAVKDNFDIPRFITEGGKKALSGLSAGLVAIALYGCSCGGKKELSPDLQPFVGDKSVIVLALDKDIKSSAIKAVNRATRRFQYLLKDIDSYFLTMDWKPEHGKGLDDLITSSPKAFKKALKDVGMRLEKLKLKNIFQEFKKPLSPDILAAQIAEEYRDILAFDNSSLRWMRYAADFPGVWSPETNEFISSIVMHIIESKGYYGYGGDSYVSSVSKMLRHHLIQRTWLERSPKELLPFKNGILEVATGKLLAHAPGYRLTWQLPREHDRDAKNWDNINDFLDHLSGNNKQIKDLLLCYCNAVIKGRSDLQKFLHLIGLGGTGKGTFARLVVSLIGSNNTHSTSLEDWCNNNFEGANAYQKRLVLFPDEDKATGKLGKFLSLTGEDWIRGENKGQKAFNYKYDGMVLVCSNLPVFAGESASRVKRRVITIPCNNAVSINKRKNLEEVFEPELPAFTNYILSLDDDYVRRVLCGIADIPECSLEFWLNRMRVDSLADWLNDRLIYDPMAKTPVGCDRNEGNDGSLIKTLFGSYSKHCRDSGSQSKASKTFSPDLIELCNSVLGWEVKHIATNTGKHIQGLRLREVGFDDEIPTHELVLMNKIKSDGSGDGSGDGSESLLDKESDGSGGKTYILNEIFNQEKNLASEPQPHHTTPQPQPQPEKNLISDETKTGINPSLTPEPLQVKHPDPSPDPSPHPSLLKEGDKIICYPNDYYANNKYQVKATITKVEYAGPYLHHCEVKYLDKKGTEKTESIGGGSADWILRKVW